LIRILVSRQESRDVINDVTNRRAVGTYL